MYTTHYSLTDDECKSFDLLMGNNEMEWGDLSPQRQQSIKDLVNKYPDIEKCAVWDGSNSSASSGIPLDNKSQIPDNLSEVSTTRAWEAFQQTKSLWEKSKQNLQQQSVLETRTPRPAPSSPALQRASIPLTPSPRLRPRSFPADMFPPGPSASVYGSPRPHSPTAPLDMAGLQISPVNRSYAAPQTMHRTLAELTPSLQRAPTSAPQTTADRRAWLLQQHEEARQRYTAALHAAVEADGDMAKYTALLQQLGDVVEEDAPEQQVEEAT